MNTQLPEPIQEMPPAAAHIYRELQWSDGDCLDVQTLKHRTGRSQATIRRATTRLEEADFVESRWSNDDRRIRLFCLRE